MCISHLTIYLRDSSTSLYIDLPLNYFYWNMMYIQKYDVHTEKCIYCTYIYSWINLHKLNTPYNQHPAQETEHHPFPRNPSPATFQIRPIPSPRVTTLLTPEQTTLGSSVYVGFMESILLLIVLRLAPFIHHYPGEIHPCHRISMAM